MKLLLKILAGVLACLVLLVLAANLLVSPDRIRDRVAERLREQTGRELTVAGTTSMTFWPNPHIVLTDASITDPAAEHTAVDFRMPRLVIDLNLIDLFSRRVDAEHVLFEQPVVLIHPAGAGAHHAALEWPHAKLEPARLGEPTPDGLRPTRYIAASLTGAGDRRDLRLKDLRIVDGTLRILDANGKVKREASDIQLRLSLPHIDDPLTAQGTFDIKRQILGFQITLTSPGALRAHQPADLSLSIASALFKARLQGKLMPGDPFTAQGQLVASAPSLKTLVAWDPDAAKDTPPLPGTLSGTLQWQPGLFSLNDAQFSLDRGQGRGRLELKASDPKPHLLAALAIQDLDLTPFLPKHGPKPERQPDGNRAGAPTQQPNDTGRDFFTNPEHQNRTAQAQGAPPPESAAPTPQSAPATPSAPIASSAASPLPPAAVDADVNIIVHHTKLGELSIGESAVALSLRGRVLTAKLGEMKLYHGQGSGELTIDATNPVPRFSGNLALDGVEAKPLLTAAAGFRVLSGETKLALNMSGAGKTAEAIKTSLNGDGSVSVSNGAVEGIDVTKIIEQIGAGRLPKLKGGKTQFSDLGGSFTVKNGIAETSDIKMQSPLLSVTAEGSVDFPNDMLDIVAHPKIVAGAEGKGGANDLAGLTIPIHIEGPLSDPSYRPELAGPLSNPEAATKTINRIGGVLQKKFKGKPVGEAIGRFLGQVQIGTEPAPPAKHSEE